MLKVSQLISKLQDMQERFGDMPVHMAHEVQPNVEALEIPVQMLAIRAGLKPRVVLGERL
jgi:hypothetical protein